MYESNETKINWKSIFKKLLILVIILLSLVLVILLIKGCNKVNNTKPIKPSIKPTIKEEFKLNNLLDQMENATMKYISRETLPLELNSTKTIKLKFLIHKNLIKELKDNNNKACDINNSYSEITKLENNYILKTQIVCENKSDYKISYIGCFEKCDKGNICLGSKNDKGICTIINDNDKPIKKDENNNHNNGSEKPNKPSNKPNNKPDKPNNKPNNKPDKPNNVNPVQYIEKTYYEQKKCDTTYFCPIGNLVLTNQCKVKDNKIITMNPINKVVKIVYTCDSGYVLNGNKCIKSGNSSTTKNAIKNVVYTKTCENNQYVYNKNSGKCEYNKEFWKYISAKEIEKCSTTWSVNKYLMGYHYTGNYKKIKISR